MSDNNELKNKTLPEISKLKENLRKLRFDNVMGQLSDTSKIKKVKKEIARKFTIINKK